MTSPNLDSSQGEPAPAPVSDHVLRLCEALFDSQFYLDAHPDIRAAGIDPISHYLAAGWKEGRDPSPTFKTTPYLDANPDVRELGICPLLDYVTLGIASGRPLSPLSSATPLRKQLQRFFDEHYYLVSYPDAAARSSDLLLDYVERGWREGRNPSPEFDTGYYLDSYPDVRAANICPLIHYVRGGMNEGRSARRPYSVARNIINSAVSAAERIKPWLHPREEVLVTSSDLQRALRTLGKNQTQGIVLALSHDNFAIVSGGVQSCIGDEQSALRKSGWSYIHLWPAQALPTLSGVTDPSTFLLWLRLNGEPIGPVSVAMLLGALRHLKWEGTRKFLVLHHLMGHSTELVAQIAIAFQPLETIAWIHDFFTLCPSYALLRNDTKFCGGPPPTSQGCEICAYGSDERKLHLKRINELFTSTNPYVLAPSDAALSFWIARANFAYKETKVIGHGKLTMDALERPAILGTQAALRVGFVGGSTYHKGWFVFEELAKRHVGDSRYSFFRFSAAPTFTRGITWIPVSVKPDSRFSMIEAIIANQIDVIINWSLCYETFSFATYEAIAGGAFVIGRKGAGNVVPAITQVGVEQGLGLETEQELFELFQTDNVAKLAAHRRYGEFSLEPATVSLIEELA